MYYEDSCFIIPQKRKENDHENVSLGIKKGMLERILS